MNLLKKWNTLRNQILVVFLVVMVIVLIIVGTLTYSRVSLLLRNNGEEQLQQVAIEANGRFESLFEQINTVTKQVATMGELQQLLINEMEGKPPTFNERQSLMKSVNTLQASTDGIYSMELFTRDFKQIIPLGNDDLLDRVELQDISEAYIEKGRLVWIGQDPQQSNYFLAIRRVSLIDRSFSSGGYLLIRINKKYFQLNSPPYQNDAKQYTILVDQELKPINSNYNGDIEALFRRFDDLITIDGEDYMVVKQTSKVTGWTLAILTPVSNLTKGISMLRTGIFLSGIVGFVIFTIFSFFLSTLITRPINRLTKTMRKASDGNLTMNPEIASTIEINELNSTYNQLVQETNHLIQMVYEKELTRSRTELKALQAQINPHFLFNTLDALYWSLEENDEEELAEHVLAMSELFRYTISQNNKDEWVTIYDELNHIKRYMQLMQMRFENKLSWEQHVPKEWQHVRIPKLLIQPLVENAILHGAGNKIGDAVVSVSIDRLKDKDKLLIVVKDDGPGMSQEKVDWIYQSIEQGTTQSDSGNGIAIINVHKRLQLYYQEDDFRGLTIESEPNKGTTVSFEIPIQPGVKNHV